MSTRKDNKEVRAGGKNVAGALRAGGARRAALRFIRDRRGASAAQADNMPSAVAVDAVMSSLSPPRGQKRSMKMRPLFYGGRR